MNITFLFPINYKHGTPRYDRCHSDTINISSVHDGDELDQDTLHILFRRTKLYDKLRYLSFDYYVNWDPVNKNTYMAKPRITVHYGNLKLDYFHNPTYKEVKYDIYLIKGKKNNIENTNDNIIETPLSGNYILLLENK